MMRIGVWIVVVGLAARAAATAEEPRRDSPEFRERAREAEELRAKIGELERELGEAKRRGEEDRARELGAKLEEHRQALRRLRAGVVLELEPTPPPARERARQAEELRARIGELEGQLGEAKRRGEEERARDIAAKLERVRRALEEIERRDQPPKEEQILQQVAKLRREAIRAKRAGQPERARDLWSEATRLESELGREIGILPEREEVMILRSVPAPVREGDVPRPREVMPVQVLPPPVEGPSPAELQREINRLREEIRDLRQMLDRALRDRPRGEGEPERPRGERER